MQEILKLQQKIVPELMELLQKRYNILRTIYYKQPIGRRILANSLELGERVVRTEINFLKKQNLIDIDTSGMTVTQEGEEIIDKLKSFIHEFKGLSEIEQLIKQHLNLKDVIVVPGDIEEDRTVLEELGKSAAKYIKGLVKDSSIVALTGGSTIKKVIDNMPKTLAHKDILVVPARGGMGKNVETQANTLTASLANKLGGSYKLLHVPDNISDAALNTILNEKSVKDVIDSLHNADILIYGVGRADKMCVRRGCSLEETDALLNKGAVGEAFGYYFNKNGEVVYSNPTIGLKDKDLKKVNFLVAVAGSRNKAEAIVATQINNRNSVLITDEGAAREIVN
ncbi:MAG: sugar-binding transcriptional regulator, partial [Bacillota bacterium]|nr:sugar-binding transcriptional regulator [Bacillota bacterium]